MKTLSEELRLYDAAIAGNVEVITAIADKSADEVRRIRTPYRNNILHLASQFGRTEVVQKILSKYSSLISEINSDGDSALHLAARGGHSDVVRALINCLKKSDRNNNAKTLDQDIETGIRDKRLDVLQRRNKNNDTALYKVLRCRNKNKDTALHEATRYNHIQVVSMLLEEDDQSTDEYRNRSGETLLYLAASRGFHDLVDVILKPGIGRDPAYGGPDGRTALHGAVICNSIDCVRKILEWRKDLRQKGDDSNLLPLCYAARLGFTNVVNELLSVGSLGNDYIALMFAASEGHIHVMKELISHLHPACFDSINWKGRNVLHIAIEHEQKAVIEYLLEECPTIVDRLIIQKDRDGNTPLHLLATSNCFVPKLIRHPRADKGALNVDGFTPRDLVICDDDISSTRHEKIKIAEELKHVGATLHNWAAHVPPSRPPPAVHFDNIKKMIDNHMLVATLIATVAFTAGFTMPGGYIQSGGQYEGMAVLSTKSIDFRAFIISDTIALILSTTALFIYFIGAFYAAGTDKIDGQKAENLSQIALRGMLCNMFGLGAMIVAFITGTYAVLQHALVLAIVTCVIACCVFPIHSFVFCNMIKLLMDSRKLL